MKLLKLVPLVLASATALLVLLTKVATVSPAVGAALMPIFAMLPPIPVAIERVQGADNMPYHWHDCGNDDTGRTSRYSFAFTNVTSVPAIVTAAEGKHQTILKTIQVAMNRTNMANPSHPTDDDLQEVTKITADYHQYYQVWGHWITFLDLKNVDVCGEHKEMCPLHVPTSKSGSKSAAPNTNVDGHYLLNTKTVHPPLAWGTPYGWYRSRQVYRVVGTQKEIGCVDMQFQYRAKAAADTAVSPQQSLLKTLRGGSAADGAEEMVYV